LKICHDYLAFHDMNIHLPNKFKILANTWYLLQGRSLTGSPKKNYFNFIWSFTYPQRGWSLKYVDFILVEL
jgi:hypothetical protein